MVWSGGVWGEGWIDMCLVRYAHAGGFGSVRRKWVWFGIDGKGFGSVLMWSGSGPVMVVASRSWSGEAYAE